MAIITISRQLGAKGDEVGKSVAEKLDYDLIDRGTLTEAAKKYPQLKTEELAHIDEIKPRFLDGIFGGSRTDYFEVLQTLITGFACKGKVVILGGGAQIFLREIPSALHVRITCSMNERVRNLAHRHNIDPGRAMKVIGDSDRNRAHFFKVLFDADANDLAFYDMVLRTDKLTAEMSANLVVEAGRQKEIEGSWEVSQSILGKMALAGEIKAAFRIDKYENLQNITVSIPRSGHVHLTGYVSSEEEKARAEQLVRSIENVEGVVNELTLMLFTPPITPY